MSLASSFKRLRFAAGVLLLLIPATSEADPVATPVVETWSVGTLIPDGDPLGYSDTRMITDSLIGRITRLSVTLETTGGYAGDLFATLSHDSGFSVLLNRIGRSSTNLSGSGASQLALILRDDALTDIHGATAVGGAITGVFQPDARDVSPLSVYDTSPRTADLSAFDGLSADGSWTLFVADVAGADVTRLDRWGLTIHGLVPEPSAASMLVAALSAFVLMRRRAR